MGCGTEAVCVTCRTAWYCGYGSYGRVEERRQRSPIAEHDALGHDTCTNCEDYCHEDEDGNLWLEGQYELKGTLLAPGYKGYTHYEMRWDKDAEKWVAHLDQFDSVPSIVPSKQLTDGRKVLEGEVLGPEYAGIPRAELDEKTIYRMVNEAYEKNMRRLIEGDWVRRERNITCGASADPAQAALPAPAPEPPEST